MGLIVIGALLSRVEGSIHFFVKSGYCCILWSRISFLQCIAKVWLSQLEMKKNFVFLHQFERYPGCFATKAAAVAKLADLANKIRSSEVVMNSEVQVLGVLEHMPASMELEGDMEQLPTFSSCPVVQILVCIKEPFWQGPFQCCIHGLSEKHQCCQSA